MQGLQEEKIAQAVFDSTDELLELASWVRGFYVALKLTGFDPKAAHDITVASAMGILKERMEGGL